MPVDGSETKEYVGTVTDPFDPRKLLERVSAELLMVPPLISRVVAGSEFRRNPGTRRLDDVTVPLVMTKPFDRVTPPMLLDPDEEKIAPDAETSETRICPIETSPFERTAIRRTPPVDTPSAFDATRKRPVEVSDVKVTVG
jgi:hypothetical protein